MNITNEEIKNKVHKALGWTVRKLGPNHYDSAAKGEQP